MDVNKASKIIQNIDNKLRSELVDFTESLGNVLVEPVVADRDLPAFDRVTMDGIAVRFNAFAKGRRAFKIIDIQGAGEKPKTIQKPDECIQIMTGASLDRTLDTVVPVEDLEISGKIATVKADVIKKAQYIHTKGCDAKKGDILVGSGQKVTPDIIAIMASVGKTKVKVVKPPTVVVISTGDELVGPADSVSEFQIRRSNDQAIYGILRRYNIKTTSIHVKDDKNAIMQTIKKALKDFDVVITVGGVSKGEYDYVQVALDKLGVKKHFHGVKQKPGKPLWFGSYGSKPIFALPGNPVSVYLCMTRYVAPWFEKSLGINSNQNIKALLDQDVKTNSNLTSFILVKTYFDDQARLCARPIKNNNSGDYASMVRANAFLELPEGKSNHKKGSLHKVWFYKDEIMSS
ncbi:MAG: molybdopterin molybdotransferase MoeA [Patescibacteria group bacterium]